MSAVEIREITVEDALWAAERDLRHEVLRKPLGRTLETSAFENASLHFVAVAGGRVIGCVLLRILGDARARLHAMAVAGTEQAKGIGRRLVGRLEAVARARGIQTIEMNARVSAQGFYERLGYRAEGEVFEKVDLPHVRMTKKL